MQDKCPECGSPDSIEEADDLMGEGYRVCASCCQEYYIDVDYT